MPDRQYKKSLQEDIKSGLSKIVHAQVVIIESNWQKVSPEKVAARNMTFTSWSYY